MTKPTGEGVRRYPATAGYHQDISYEGTAPDLEFPCICSPACQPRCSGACGCAACSLAFAIYMDEAGFFGAEPMTVEQEAEAFARYQDV